MQTRKYAGPAILLTTFFIFIFISIFRMNGTVYASYAYGCILPDSSHVYLSEQDIENMPLQVICYAKNEIYARNGRMFHSAELQGYFDQQYWYSPVYEPESFSQDMLNVYETANAALLENREALLGGYETDAAGYSYDAVYAYISQNGADQTQDTAAEQYEVDPYAYIFYDSNARYLTPADVDGLSLQELCYARNEIYARHGRIFNSQELQNYFSQKDWYYGLFTADEFSKECLNEYETANARLLYAREYALSPDGYLLDGDSFSYTEIGYYIDYEEAKNTASSDDDYIFRDSNTRYLTDADLQGLSLQMLCYARNEIYARRGYIFNYEELRSYFGQKSWYNGTIVSDQFSSSVFNEYEAANVALLQQYEYSISPDGYQLY